MCVLLRGHNKLTPLVLTHPNSSPQTIGVNISLMVAANHLSADYSKPVVIVGILWLRLEET